MEHVMGWLTSMLELRDGIRGEIELRVFNG